LEQQQPFPLYIFEQIGQQVYALKDDLYELLQFIGELTISLGAMIRHPGQFRLRATVYHLEKVGLNALPIVGLISFLIGVVLVYQGAYQLKRFGAEIFTVDLLAVSALREIGILLTAIVVAGRSGSAFTAQIGFMKLNQEIDAMWVMGLNPFHVLVIPRLIALLIALPLLTFYSDLMALLGGGVMCISLIDLAFDQFLHHLHLAIKPWTFWTGMIKAPIFAIAISVIGCFEGMRVHGGADHVGTQTTRSVVESIFLVIVIDAAFSVLYSYLGI
jgi:phospholipid/cholesterol/gamma-HCH transport system permease protein